MFNVFKKKSRPISTLKVTSPSYEVAGLAGNVQTVSVNLASNSEGELFKQSNQSELTSFKKDYTVRIDIKEPQSPSSQRSTMSHNSVPPSPPIYATVRKPSLHGNLQQQQSVAMATEQPRSQNNTQTSLVNNYQNHHDDTSSDASENSGGNFTPSCKKRKAPLPPRRFSSLTYDVPVVPPVTVSDNQNIENEEFVSRTNGNDDAVFDDDQGQRSELVSMVTVSDCSSQCSEHSNKEIKNNSAAKPATPVTPLNNSTTNQASSTDNNTETADCKKVDLHTKPITISKQDIVIDCVDQNNKLQTAHIKANNISAHPSEKCHLPSQSNIITNDKSNAEPDVNTDNVNVGAEKQGNCVLIDSLKSDRVVVSKPPRPRKPAVPVKPRHLSLSRSISNENNNGENSNNVHCEKSDNVLNAERLCGGDNVKQVGVRADVTHDSAINRRSLDSSLVKSRSQVEFQRKKLGNAVGVSADNSSVQITEDKSAEDMFNLYENFRLEPLSLGKSENRNRNLSGSTTSSGISQPSGPTPTPPPRKKKKVPTATLR